MVWNNRTLISLPTALAGFVLGCLPSPADGHGNNPRQDTRVFSRTPNDPNIYTDTDPPAQNANAPGMPGGNTGPGPDAMDLLNELGVESGVGVAFAGPGTDLDLGSLIGQDLGSFGETAMGTGNYITGPIDVPLATALMDRGFHSTGSSVLPSSPVGGAIPAPGTLALLALAGTALGRRRRRA
jgi:hypothetical protein